MRGEVRPQRGEHHRLGRLWCPQRLPHRQEPNRPCPVDVLRQLGVVSWHINPDGYAEGDVAWPQAPCAGLGQIVS